MKEEAGHRSLRVASNALEHRVLEWSASEDAPSRGTVLLVHGFMDAAGTWDRVAPRLAAHGLRVLAPDMRGFGEGARLPPSGYYHFVDYVFDLADLVDALTPNDPIAIVGHSMGGTISTLFAGTFPERIRRLVLLEGLGPPDNPYESGPVRMRRWIEGVRQMRARTGARHAFSRDQALSRLAANHVHVPEEVLADRLPYLVEGAGEGLFSWRYDPLHRTTSPVPFFSRLFNEFARLVTAPTLFVSGGPLGYHPPDEAARLAAFPQLERAEIADAGHMMHWTRPDEVATLLERFL